MREVTRPFTTLAFMTARSLLWWLLLLLLLLFVTMTMMMMMMICFVLNAF